MDPPDGDYGDDNNNSMLTTVTYKGRRALFAGDARKKRMEEFLRTAPGDIDFIKLPHHGDGNKALYSLLRGCAPRWAVATVSEAEVLEPVLRPAGPRMKNRLFPTGKGRRYFVETQGVHVFFSKLKPQWRQVMRMRPFPLGTRTVRPQPGQRKKA